MGILSLVFTALGAISNISQSKKADEARREANSVKTASQKVTDRASRRRAAKEARIKRARLIQSAEVSGASGSSGLVGATSAIGSNLGNAIATQTGQRVAATAISAANQRAADAESSINRTNSLVRFGTGVVDTLQEEGIIK